MTKRKKKFHNSDFRAKKLSGILPSTRSWSSSAASTSMARTSPRNCTTGTWWQCYRIFVYLRHWQVEQIS